MKRTAEFVLGLIGGIVAVIISVMSFINAGFVPLLNEDVETMVNATMISNSIGLIISIVGLVFACLVNKNAKKSGIIMIITGVLLPLFNLFTIISCILFLIAGIMCVVRKVDVNCTQNTSN